MPSLDFLFAVLFVAMGCRRDIFVGPIVVLPVSLRYSVANYISFSRECFESVTVCGYISASCDSPFTVSEGQVVSLSRFLPCPSTVLSNVSATTH